MFTHGASTPVFLDHRKITDPSSSAQYLLTSDNHADPDAGDVVDLGLAGQSTDGPVADDPKATVSEDTWFQGTKSFQPAPSNVFDATDFGAVPGSAADATPAIQKAIDAAREAGGAMAYIPVGRYHLHSTLKIHGSYYVVSGGGYRTWLYWDGETDASSADSVMVKVTDPDEVTLSNLNFFSPRTVAAVRQTSSGDAPSKILYEALSVPGSFQGPPAGEGVITTTAVTRSFELVKLSAASKVHFGVLNGTFARPTARGRRSSSTSGRMA